MMSPLDYALELAGKGHQVFFCKLDKSPTCPHGFYNASNDPGTLFDLWWLHPGSLVAVATGAASGIDVVDIDVKHLAALEWWQLNATRLPVTRIHVTRGGGYHLLFRHRSGMRNSASRIANGVDVRADGGYIIYWPAAGLPMLCAELPAEWPDWLAELTESHVSTAPPEAKSFIRRQPRHGNNRYAQAALRRAAEQILKAPNGHQEQVINREAFSIGTLIGAKLLTKEDVHRELLAIADQVPSLDPLRPWAPGDVRKKIERGLAQGMRRPRASVRG